MGVDQPKVEQPAIRDALVAARNEASSAGSIEWSWIPAVPSRISDGARIEVRSSELPEARRADLERCHGVVIEPVRLVGKEIGYRIGSSDAPADTAVVCCHAGFRRGAFQKPADIELRFVAPRNTALVSRMLSYAEQLRCGEVGFEERQVHWAGQVDEVPNYPVSGNVEPAASSIASFIRIARDAGTPIGFDFILVNGGATGVNFSDLVQAIVDTPGGGPTNLVCHFCRPEDEQYAEFRTF